MKIHLLISGRVQGVFYRANTKKKADELGLKGWVKNRPDGRVEAFFSGPKAEVEKMIEWCWQGSSQAQVEKIIQLASMPDGELTGFEIRY